MGDRLWLIYVFDFLLAPCGVVLLWDWSAGEVMGHHWPTLVAVACMRLTRLSPGECAPWLFAAGLAIQYNEAMWNLLALYRPPWLQRIDVFIRASVYPPLLAADAVTYMGTLSEELAVWADGEGARARALGAGWAPRQSLAKLFIVQLMLPMMYQHVCNFSSALRLIGKLQK